ncbi:TPA: glycosyltransferase, partial [Candidatus Micrarchaeota archaeon]|nr:glycosyltransferase [Candidatus Micrarchaeota archaeon]
AREAGIRVVALGSGPVPPCEGAEYVRVRWDPYLSAKPPSSLSVREYAFFSKCFGEGATDVILGLSRDADPRDVLVIHNDIAEAPDFRRLREAGLRQVTIFHVDVVDYVSRIYLRGLIPPHLISRGFRFLKRTGLHRALPLVAKLVLGKQDECVRNCDLLVVPSRGMADVLERSFPEARGRVAVIPWGAVEDPVEGEIPDIRERYGISESTPVIITLSRISPEKGQDLLLRALRIWDRKGGRKLVAFICGAPAFMHGEAYLRRLRRLSRGLKRVEVHFPGHVVGAEKRGFLSAADLYVFPSRHESYGLTLAEALRAGLPVLTTRHYSAGELVRPEFGLVVEPCPRDIYRGLTSLLSDREKLAEMGKRAREFSRNLSFDRAFHELLKRLRSLGTQV